MFPAMTDLSFDCPRCGEPAEGRFYGPCDSCAKELRAKYLPETRQVDAPDYEPKMNVTPNAVATKE